MLLNFVLCATTTSAVPSDLRVEYLAAPLGVDVTRPRFSWIVPPLIERSMRGLGAQRSYQLQVAHGAPTFDVAGALVMNVTARSARSTRVLFAPIDAASELRSSSRYYWRVRVWRNASAGAAPDWTAPSTFGTGLFARTDWHGAWISAPKRPSAVGYLYGSSGVLRCDFVIPSGERVQSAFAFVAATGLVELRLNGQPAGRSGRRGEMGSGSFGLKRALEPAISQVCFYLPLHFK